LRTAKALEDMTDQNKFEILATAVIAAENPDYAPLIHTGINTAGKTIKSPVDGYCLVPGSSPPHFVFACHTTTASKSLRTKWLSDQDEDLVKAGREAKKERARHPNAKFTVVLTTNHRPDKTLCSDVYDKALNRYQVTVDIWDQSRLARVLDSTPEGQWLRKEYLGIDTEMLSGSLLRHLGQISLEAYKDQHVFSDRKLWVSRDADGLIEAAIEDPTCALQLLCGESGFGKSVLVYKALEKHISAGGYCLWVPAKYIADCVTFYSALEATLKGLYPQLQAGIGADIRQVLPDNEHLILIVDDINRASEPDLVLRKIRSWTGSSINSSDGPPDAGFQSESTETRPARPYLVVCPVWPKYADGADNKRTWIKTDLVDRLSPDEATSAVLKQANKASIKLTHEEAERLADRLSHDPILISLFGETIDVCAPDKIEAAAGDAIKAFIGQRLEQASRASAGGFLAADYRQALAHLVENMLKNRRLFPTWAEITVWLNPDERRCVRELISDGKVCRLSTEAGEETFTFRHDRIQSFWLTEGLAEIIHKAAPGEDILAEPNYAQGIGQALAKTPKDRAFLEHLLTINPLAVIIALKSLETEDSEYSLLIGEIAADWIQRSLTASDTPASLALDICRALVETDSTVVLEATEGIARGLDVWSKLYLHLARLRNGSAADGAAYHSIMGASYHLQTADKLRDRILNRAIERHSDQLLTNTEQALKDDAMLLNDREAWLIFAGFLGFDELATNVLRCWQQSGDKLKLLPAAIWAAARCGSEQPKAFLAPLVAFWNESLLTDPPADVLPTDRVSDWLHSAFESHLNDKVVGYFIECFEKHEALRWPIAHMCELANRPETIELLVKSGAQIIAKAADEEVLEHRITSSWGGFYNSRRLSDDSKIRLSEIWNGNANNVIARKLAFDLWLNGLKKADLTALRDIDPDSPLYERAIFERARLCDMTVIPALSRLLTKNTGFFHVAHHVWCQEIARRAETYLASFKSDIPKDFTGGTLDPHHDLSRLLIHIPIEDAEPRLERYWQHLGHSRLFIQAALYIGTPKCLELAASSISACPSEIDVFQYLEFCFGFNESSRQNLITVEKLNALTPYLERFDEHLLQQVAKFCQRQGFHDWIKEHLRDRFSDDLRKRYLPTDDDLLESFGSERAIPNVQVWLQDFEARGDSWDRAMRILRRWVKLFHSDSDLQRSMSFIGACERVAECLRSIGTRKDLALLDNFIAQREPQAHEFERNTIAEIVRDVRFDVMRHTLE